MLSLKKMKKFLIFLFLSILIYYHNSANFEENEENFSRPNKELENRKTTCFLIYGTRPEFIKLFLLIKKLKSNGSQCILTVISTGQHRELLIPLENYYGVLPDINMKILRPNQTLTSLFSRMVQKFSLLFELSKPDFIIVQGDTTTAMAASITAFHHDIHVIHVEAGLRTGDISSPFPEEFNRKAIGLVCSLCFAPTNIARDALVNEGVNLDRIFNVGNTVVDSLYYSIKYPPQSIKSKGYIEINHLANKNEKKKKLKLYHVTSNLIEKGVHIVLITIHRRESVLSGSIKKIVRSIYKLSLESPSTIFIIPIHYNPNIRNFFFEKLGKKDNIYIIEPFVYPIFVEFLLRITLILTDSGGIQEEGVSLKIPILIMRNKTERTEGIMSGGAILLGDNEKEIVKKTMEIITNKQNYNKMVNSINPYGDGMSTERIYKILNVYSNKLKNIPARNLLKFEFDKNKTKNFLSYKSYQEIMMSFKSNSINEIKKLIKSNYIHSYQNNSITIIMTGFKRPASHLRKQIESLKKSSLKPAQIIFYQNRNFTDFLPVLNDHPDIIHIFNRNHNFKFHGRFTIALLAKTKFVAVIDDEPICGEKWIEYAVENVEKLNAMVGSSGRRILPSIFNNTNSSYLSYQVLLDSKFGSGYNEVDFVGHWWIWKTEWTFAMWSLPSFNLWTGEDIEFSAKLKMLLGIKSVTLNFPSKEYNPEKKIKQNLDFVNGKIVASCLVPNTTQERISVALFWISKGWKPIFLN